MRYIILRTLDKGRFGTHLGVSFPVFRVRLAAPRFREVRSLRVLL